MISVTILTKNSERYLDRVLYSVKDFDEVLIYDTGSTDKTLEIARSFPQVRIYEGPFEGFGKTHNRASSCAKNDWIFSVDSDEIVSDSLKDEIRVLKLDPGSIYSISRKNYYNGKWIRWCGWYPDRVFRLYNKKKTQFSDAEVHEAVMKEGMNWIALSSHLIHYPYRSADDFLKKMQAYSDLFAKQNRGKRSSFAKALIHGAFAFIKSYVLQRGFMGGAEGYIISKYNADTAFYKYLKLADIYPESDS